MLENIFYIFLIIINTISCLDLRLSLGQKLESNLYPVIINLNEPLIFEINKIDLFCAYDISGSMAISGRTENLKKALNLLVEALDSQDRLTLIPFDHNSETIFDLEYMTSSNKEKANSLIDKIKPRGGTDFRPPIREIINGLKKISNERKSGRVQSVIFLTDGEVNEPGKKIIFELLTKEGLINTSDITVNTFGFSADSGALGLIQFSDSRDGAFYSIDELSKAKDYVLNVIGAMRTTSYKNLKITIVSKYEINKFYGCDHLSNYQISPDKKLVNNKIYQFITGKDYTYVMLVKIPDGVSIGDTILTVNADFTDIYGNYYKAYNYLRFYHAIGCFNCFKEEHCRVLAMETLEQSIKKKDVSELNKIKYQCTNYLNENITSEIDHIKNIFNNEKISDNKRNNYIYGVISEGFLKRNGMNIWYSNEYQYELINDFLYNKDTRYFWERFHVPYWKIYYLRYIHRVTGVPLQFIFILIVITICIPLSLISVLVFKGIGRLIFNMIVGLIIQIVLFDVAFLNVFVACSIVYTMLRFTKIHGGPILFSLFGYLMCVHIFHFIFYRQTLDFGASPFLFMYAIAKITFFTYAVRERNVNPASFINQYHRYCITDKKIPSYLEYLSYIYFFPSAIYGPCFQIKDYLNYIYNNEEYKRMNLMNELRKGFIRIAVGYGLIALFYFCKYYTYFQFGIFKIYEYLASDDVLAMNIFFRFLLIYGYCVYIKLFVYGFFQLIYGIFMTTGVAYNEEITLVNLKGGDDYILDLSDKKGHCGNILKSDFGYNIGEAINHFNRSIHIYLKYCVYIRIIFLRTSWIKNYFIAAIFVFLFAALWCGIYIGIYSFFACACIIYQFHFNLELFGFYDWLDNAHIAIKITITIFVQYILSMIFNMLFLYKIEMTWCYLRNYYGTPVIIVLVLYFTSLILRLRGFHKDKSEEKKINRSKNKKKAGKREKFIYSIN